LNKANDDVYEIHRKYGWRPVNMTNPKTMNVEETKMINDFLNSEEGSAFEHPLLS